MKIRAKNGEILDLERERGLYGNRVKDIIDALEAALSVPPYKSSSTGDMTYMLGHSDAMRAIRAAVGVIEEQP